MPAHQSVDGDGEQLDVVPARDLADAVAHEGGERGDAIAERRQSLGADFVERSLGDYIGALPVLAAIDHHQDPPGPGDEHRLVAVGRLARQAEPQDIHRRAERHHRQPGARADDRGASVGGDDEIGAHLERTFRRRRLHADHPPRFLDEPGHLGAHLQREGGKSHCGIRAMNLQRVGKCVKSTTGAVRPPKCAVSTAAF